VYVTCGEISDAFEDFKTKYGKSYESDSEESERFSIFESNYNIVEGHNAQGKSWTLGINKYADLTLEEFVGTYVGKLGMDDNEEKIYVDLEDASVDDSRDWTTLGVVGDIKDQYGCGSCWAFSAVSSIEGTVAQATGLLTALSEQNLVDCSTMNSGCEGGLMTYAFMFAESDGLCMETEYPYTGYDQSCASSSCSSLTTISSYSNVVPSNEAALKLAVANQVVSVAIEADTSSFQLYSSGVYSDETCGTDLDHGVSIVGYGTSDDGMDYWIVRNSWGTDWGLDGYMMMSRGSGLGDGTCGIAMMASYATY